jgi:putative DNA primase/helicase
MVVKVSKEEILQRVDFEAFYSQNIDKFKNSPSGQATGLCPFHDDVEHRSISINTENGLWNCKGCGAKGDFFGFYGRITGIDPATEFRRLLEMIANEFGLGGAPPTEAGRIVVTKKASKKIAPPPRNPIPEGVVKSLRDAISKEMLAALSDIRGIPVSTLVDFGVGWDAARNRYALPIRDYRGRTMNIRLYSPSLDPKILNWWHWECPACGALVRVPLKRSGAGGDEGQFCRACKKPLSKSDYRTYGTVRLFPLDKFMKVDPSECCALEGEWDTIMLWGLGVPCLTSTGGALTWKPSWLRAFKGRKTAFVFDADEQGRTAALKHGRTLLSSGEVPAVSIVTLPLKGTKDDKDITDWFKQGKSLESLIGVIKTAPKLELADEEPTDEEVTPLPPDDKPDIYKVADLFIKEHPFAQKDGVPIIRFWKGGWYRWTDKFYKPMSKDDIVGKISTFMEFAFGGYFRKRSISSLVKDILMVLQGKLTIPSIIEPPVLADPAKNTFKNLREIISFNNGILDVRTALKSDSTKLMRHSPRLFHLNSLPFNYDRSAKCPRFMDTIEYFWPDPEVRKALQEFVGMLLVPDIDYQYFLLLIGEGENGKSTLFEVIQYLLGRDNYSSLDLKQLGTRFGGHSLVGKLANICGDVRESDTEGETLLKAVVGGDDIQVERKNKDPFSTKLTTRFLFAANTFPRFNDKTHGLWRKALIIPCNVQIPAEKRDNRWKVKIREEELPGVFNWALRGLISLRERGFILEPKVCTESKEIQREALNPARSFLKDTVKVVEGRKIKCGELYSKFAEFCTRNGFRKSNERNFGQEVFRLFKERTSRIRLRNNEGVREYYYSNLVFIQDWEDEEGPEEEKV